MDLFTAIGELVKGHGIKCVGTNTAYYKQITNREVDGKQVQDARILMLNWYYNNGSYRLVEALTDFNFEYDNTFEIAIPYEQFKSIPPKN